MLALVKTKAVPLQQNIAYFMKPLVTTILSPRFSVYTDHIQGSRTLFSKYSLGVEGFLKQGERLRDDIKSSEDRFIKKMQNLEHVSDKSQIVYTEDLKKLVALCQEEKELLDLIISLMKKYYEHIRGINLKPFRFGPSVIRLIYIHELTDKAIEVLLDEELADYFNEDASYQVAMDLLYKKGCYEDVLKLMQAMKSFPKSCVTLALAANYKIATEESFEDALDLNRKVYESKQHLTFRMIAFTSGLALKMGKPEIALEICAHSKSLNHYLVNNLRILAKARIGELEEVMRMLETNTLIDSPKISKFTTKHVFAADVIEEVEKIVNETTLQLELTSNFSHLKKTLQDMDLISPQSLEQSICGPIIDVATEERPRQRQGYYDRYNYGHSKQYNYRERNYFRPGFSNRWDKSSRKVDSSEEE